ncbi:MAG: hypothetical protein ABEI98_07290, partial [Halorhabdus sp.]
KAHALLEQADMVQVTGSAANVQAGQESGTPNYCVSEGNPVALVAESAAFDRVAAATVESAGYDWGTACIAESCVIVPESVYQQFRTHLDAVGAYCCGETESTRIRETLFPDGQSHPERDLVGQPPADLAARADVDVPADTSLLAVEPADIDTDPLVTECLAPLVTTISVPDFEAGIDVAERILDREGAGHSVAIHTDDREKAVRAGRRLDVCRAVVNQPNLASSGTVTNGLTHSLSMGGGTWAGNQLAENLSYRQFIQTTRIAFPTKGEEPSDSAVFGAHLAADGDADTPGTDTKQPDDTERDDAEERGLLSRLLP